MKKKELKKNAIRALAEIKYGYWMQGYTAVEYEIYPYIRGAAIGLGIDFRDLENAVKKEFKIVLNENKRKGWKNSLE